MEAMRLGLRGRSWIPIGPSPLSKVIKYNGLVCAIAISPSNPNVVYVGTGGGGLWRTMDAGHFWQPLFDRQPTLGIGEPGGIAINPINPSILYVGTSRRLTKEPTTAGLFKSTDYGYSWIRLGSGYPVGNTGNAKQFFEQNININVILVDPTNTSTLYLASDDGFFRSTDGGLNWTETGNFSKEVLSLVLDSSTGSPILYAGIIGIGVFKSNDGGLNWTQILSSATPSVQTSFSKAVVDIAPATSSPNPAGVQILYVALRGVGSVPDAIGIYLSTDQGATWSQQSGTDVPKPQFDYAFHMAVDPGSPGDGVNDILYLGGVLQSRSDDSGNKFEDISSGLHPDTHAWAFSRQPSPIPSIVYSGNDGGLFKSTDKGATWEDLNSGLVQTTLFYNVTTKPDGPGLGIQVGAFQDNGIFTTSTAVADEWKGDEINSDGGDVAYDKNGRFLYASNWGGKRANVYRSTDNGLTIQKTITPWDASEQADYIASVAADPNTSGIVYVSGNHNLWQSFDSGSTWRVITPISGSCDGIDVAKGNGNHVVISIDKKVFLSTNALADTVEPFTEITRNLPGRDVMRVAFDPNDPSTIYAVLGGFSDPNNPNDKGNVFRTNISASSWTDISPNFSAPFSAIALDGATVPSTIYAGTEFGVLRTVDGGSFWSVLDEIHFPRVPVLDLELRGRLLVAATYGRGAFAFFTNIGDPIIAMNLENNLAFGTVRQGPAYLKLQIFNVGDPGRGGIIVRHLVIESVQRLMGSNSFSVLPTPNTPIVIPAGEHIDFTVEYNPAGGGIEEIATIRIVSNDLNASYVDLPATGRQEAYD